MLDNKIILENDAVLLKPISAADLSGYADIAIDEAIWKYFVFNIENYNDVVEFVEDGIKASRTGERICFTIISKHYDQIVGSMSFGNVSHKDRRLEIGWSWLGSTFQGTGINQQAKFLMMQYAFETLSYHRVEFKTDVLNQQARRGLVKIGAAEEGILRSHTQMPHNRRRDTIYYSVLESEWPKIKSDIFGRK